MTFAYDLALKALRLHLRTVDTLSEDFDDYTAEATTAIVNADGTLDMIPLDILSEYVNIKKMWTDASFPIAILFREDMYDWYGLFPASVDLSAWNLVAMPGRDHDIRRAVQLAERAIRSDFAIPTASVQHATKTLIPVVSLSAWSPHTEPVVEPAPAHMVAPSD